MNVARQPKVVLLGFLSHFPVAGVAWQTVHYLLGFQKLGCEVYYVEAHGCTPSKLMRNDQDDGPARAAEHIAGVMERFGLKNRWAYHAIYDSRYFGLSETKLKQLYQEAALIINLHGSHLPTPELTATNRLVFLETDPVDLQIDLHTGKKEAIDYLTPHCAFFTFGENLGAPDCLVPDSSRFKFLPTRQPVVMEFWEAAGRGGAASFTTVGNWRQPWREVQFNGETLRWSKHFEFHKFITLPKKCPNQAFELALSSYNEEDQRLLESHGWRVRPGLGVSQDMDVYRDYISGSRGEFTVAKEQNIRLRSGWFSDRAVTYLAAGRPVITQETGFSNIFPTGEGLFAFSTLDELVGAVTAINADYEKHRRAARDIAQNYFSHEVVLGSILRELGVSGAGGAKAEASALPADLILTPVSRWPTRLAEETLQTALALPVPVVKPRAAARGDSASIIIVTHNKLAYTKLCLAPLLAQWRAGDELIMVDNASTDGTPEFLLALAKQNRFVHVIGNDNNRGFAAANNQGLEHATGGLLVLLNNDTLVPAGWRDALAAHLEDPVVGLVGPVTNRTCNEAQIDAPYTTFAAFEQFAQARARAHPREARDMAMLAMFCVAMRRDAFRQVGPLDEQFEVGMFEDDDYSRRVRAAGFKIACAEGVFVHHFGQASFGELCANGEYDRVLEANRARFEKKWNVTWQPHARRITPEYEQLRGRIRQAVEQHLPAGAKVAVINKGDEELLRFAGRTGWHFPQADNGLYANIYPADSAEAIAQLEAVRRKGAAFLVIPQPAFWWLEHYAAFKAHLDGHYPCVLREDGTCLIFDLKGGVHA
jgi:GT2 family glycosyltransferase